MYAILCLKDGDSSKPIPIVSSKDDGMMATWKELKDAKEFALNNMLCQISEVFFINLEDGEIDF
jgi:hypothetical protein